MRRYKWRFSGKNLSQGTHKSKIARNGKDGLCFAFAQIQLATGRQMWEEKRAREDEISNTNTR